MNRTDRIELEYISALETNPANAALNNDYAVFLYKYKNDRRLALKYLNRALVLEPNNKTFRSNILKIVKYNQSKSQKRYYVFSLIIAAVMIWIGYSGYTNFMNLLSLFVLAQIVLNYQHNQTKIYS